MNRYFIIRYQFFKVIKTYKVVAINYQQAINDFVFKTGINKKNVLSVTHQK